MKGTQSECEFCLSMSPTGGASEQTLLADPRYAQLNSAFCAVSEMTFDVRLPINNPARNKPLW